MLTIERLAKYSHIYKLFSLLQDNDIDCDLYYTATDFTIKFKKYPNLLCVAGDITTNYSNSITYQNNTRTVKNLTSKKAFERLMSFFNKKEVENDRTRLEIARVEK